MRFRRGTDYKTEFTQAVATLIDNHIADRTERMLQVDALINEYIGGVGAAPEAPQLQRLTDYILHEELTDKHPDKVTREEYPILSEYQMERRQAREVSLEGMTAQNSNNFSSVDLASDGKDYRKPTRRKRTMYELTKMDEQARKSNDIRRKQQSAFERGNDAYKRGSEIMPVKFLTVGEKEYRNVPI